MSKPVNRLGKGLSALIGPRPAPPASATDSVEQPPRHAPPAAAVHPTPAAGLSVEKIDPARISHNPNQPRQTFDETSLAELADSIRANGVIQPILVRPRPGGNFELVAGERRLRAAIQAGLSAIPAIVREISDQESVEMAIVENIQREDLGPLERAAAYEKYLATFHCPVEQLAKRLGESRANVTNYIRLLRLPVEIRDAIQRGELGMGQARAIAGMADPQKQRALAQLAIRRNMSVRQVEALAKNDEYLAPPTAEPRRPESRQASNVEQSLSREIGLPVRLVMGKKKNTGRVIIEFRSLDEFDRISERLAGSARLD